MSRKLLLAAFLGATVLIPINSVTSVHAQSSNKEKALEVFEQGNTQYNLGKWEKAIKLFEQAYTLHPYPAFLFNIAQSHRQSGDCKQASFFYKRYLTEKQNPPNRKQVEELIREVEEECRRKVPVTPALNPDTPKPNPDTSTPNPNTSTPAPTPDTTPTTDTTPIVPPKKDESSEASPVLVAYAYVGPSFLPLDEDEDFDPETIVNVTVGAGYPIALGSLTLDVGGLVSYQALPWLDEGADDEGATGFITLMGNVGISMEAIDKLRIRGELGAGIVLVSGLDEENNPFLDGDEFTGIASEVAFRIAIGAEYALTDSIAVSVEPLVYQLTPAPDGVVIDSFDSIQALFGVRYTM